MKILLSLLVLSAFISGSTALAGSAGGTDSCGAGWYVTQRKSLLATTVRNTTNAFLPPTFSMTSGTSNCDQHAIVQADKEGVSYAQSNTDSLKVEMAQGHGQYLAAIGELMGCASGADLGAMTRREYSALVPSANTSGIDLYFNLKAGIQADPSLSRQCLLPGT